MATKLGVDEKFIDYTYAFTLQLARFDFLLAFMRNPNEENALFIKPIGSLVGIIGKVNPRLHFENEPESSENILQEEIGWAIDNSLKGCLLPGPSSNSTNYAMSLCKILDRMKDKMSYMKIWFRIPVIAGDDSWESWKKFYRLCEGKAPIKAALDFSTSIGINKFEHRWFQENEVDLAIIDSSCFISKEDGGVYLPKAFEDLMKKFLQIQYFKVAIRGPRRHDPPPSPPGLSFEELMCMHDLEIYAACIEKLEEVKTIAHSDPLEKPATSSKSKHKQVFANSKTCPVCGNYSGSKKDIADHIYTEHETMAPCGIFFNTLQEKNMHMATRGNKCKCNNYKRKGKGKQ